MSVEVMAMAAGAILSVLFRITPKVNVWFDGQDSNTKRVIMVMALVVITALITAVSCSGISLPFGFTCEKGGNMIGIFLSALATNQGVFMLTPTRKSTPAPAES